MSDAKRTTRRQRFLVHGANALLASLASIGIAVVGYILVDRYRPFRIDMTSAGIYDLSPRSLEILKDLEGPVQVTYFEVPGSETPHADSVNSRTSELLEEYRVNSAGKIEYRVANPYREALLMEELGVSELGSAVVQRGEDRIVVSSKEMYETDFGNFDSESPRLKFTAEEALSSAFLRLGDGSTTVACFLQGHGESSIEENAKFLADVLRSDNLTSRTVVITEKKSGEPKPGGPIDINAPETTAMMEVPADCSVLVIPGPSKGTISDREIDAIARYHEGGRGVVLLTDPMTETRVELLAKRLGVEQMPGIVLDSEQRQSPISTVPEWERHDITNALAEGEIPAVFRRAAGLKEPAAPDASIKLTPIMKSSEATLVVVDIKDGKIDPTSDKHIPGPVPLGYAIERTVAEGKTVRAVVIGDSDFATDGLVEAYGAGNITLAKNAVAWANGGRAKLAIGSKDSGIALISPDLTFNGALMILASTALLMPATILSCGIFVWYRRRSR